MGYVWLPRSGLWMMPNGQPQVLLCVLPPANLVQLMQSHGSVRGSCDPTVSKRAQLPHLRRRPPLAMSAVSRSWLLAPQHQIHGRGVPGSQTLWWWLSSCVENSSARRRLQHSQRINDSAGVLLSYIHITFVVIGLQLWPENRPSGRGRAVSRGSVSAFWARAVSGCRRAHHRSCIGCRANASET